MYEYVLDKAFLKQMRGECGGIMNQLVQRINNDSVMTVETILIGSGARNLVMQNGRGPVDLDYNLCILATYEIDINDGRAIRAYVRRQFNAVLRANGWGDCHDSTSAFTTKCRQGNPAAFKIDVGIVTERNNQWFRLIHEKPGVAVLDRYYWNPSPHSKGLSAKVAKLKEEYLWLEVRKVYRDLKNMYLSRQDNHHPSFIVFIEAVNEVYYHYFGR